MRKVITHRIESPGRDTGKVFIITEMGARPAHRWATKAIFALINAGVDVPDDMQSMGLAGVAVMGLSAVTKLPHAVAEPLLDELLECVQIKQEVLTRPLVDEDIEEVKTYFDLQRVVLTMHIEPFISGGVQGSESSPIAQKQTA